MVKPEENVVPDIATYARLVGPDFHDGTIEVDEWIHLKAEVRGSEGRFYVDDLATPALVVPEMFGGADLRGGVGLYVDNGTEGNFKNLKVTHAD